MITTLQCFSFELQLFFTFIHSAGGVVYPVHYTYRVPLWKKAPFTRLLLPLVAGILLQWYLQFTFYGICACSILGVSVFGLFFIIPLGVRFKLQALHGVTMNGLLLCVGLLVTWQKDIRNHSNWYGNLYKQGDILLIKIAEPLVEKPKSYKAGVFVEAIIRNGSVIPCKGRTLLYFAKDSTDRLATPGVAQLLYGDKILIRKTLQRIKSSGNPGAFNYERYAAFQQIFHQAFLKQNDWVRTGIHDAQYFKSFLFKARENILNILRSKITGGKDELGIAQALLIGYTNDLDKDLVQAYSNTGVVHIIAISGMHLALIYLLLVGIFQRIPYIKESAFLKIVLILSCLWIFSLLTGASASVVRAAVMFSFITIGANFKKHASIYNSMAAAAFIMLCYNPYFLWDAGFQLSFLAVVSIVVFQRPVLNWLYFKNKWAEKTWELAAVSLSAQVLTFPVCIYYFHQFPNLFLLTNIIAVPLSGVILYAEIALLCLCWIPFIGTFLGKAVTWLVWIMNQLVLWVNTVPYAVWKEIPATVLSTFLLYGLVIGFTAWLINKKLSMLAIGLFSLLGFVLEATSNQWHVQMRQQLIVYNIQQYRAIDFTRGNQFFFVGDTALLNDQSLLKYNLAPTRVALQLNDSSGSLKNLFQQHPFYQFNAQTILLVDSGQLFARPVKKLPIGIIVLSHNPPVSISQLAEVFDCRQYVFDASNSLWKIDKWQKECEELHLRSYSVPSKGAFIVDVGK